MARRIARRPSHGGWCESSTGSYVSRGFLAAAMTERGLGVCSRCLESGRSGHRAHASCQRARPHRQYKGRLQRSLPKLRQHSKLTHNYSDAHLCARRLWRICNAILVVAHRLGCYGLSTHEFRLSICIFRVAGGPEVACNRSRRCGGQGANRRCGPSGRDIGLASVVDGGCSSERLHMRRQRRRQPRLSIICRNGCRAWIRRSGRLACPGRTRPGLGGRLSDGLLLGRHCI